MTKKKNKKSQASAIFHTGILLAGMAFLAYPAVGNWWNVKTQSHVVAEYHAAAAMLETESGRALADAEAYNRTLAEMGSAKAFSKGHPVAGYKELLDISGTGVMGTIRIDRIHVELPIYHGTSAEALAAGAGHLEGSSLPVGGKSTHSVITGHRGLPGDLLFTRLDQLEIGDSFTVRVIDRELTYKVDQIKVVEPSEFQDLYIEEGKDYCTLMTCTPYGINSHRLLVRGKRTENAPGLSADEGKRLRLLIPFAVPALAIFGIILLSVMYWKRKAMEKNNLGKF